MVKLRTYLCLTALCLALVTACKPDPVDEPDPVDYSTGVLVLNEGVYTWGNASVSHYDPATGEVRLKVFEGANGRPPGDVLQSANYQNGSLWLVANNSGTIEGVDPVTFVSDVRYVGMGSPRYMVAVSNTEYLLSDLYADRVRKIDLNSRLETGSLNLPGWSEEMLYVAGEVLVCGTDSAHLYFVNPDDMSLQHSLYVGREPNSLVMDAEGKVWVLCSGGLGEELPRLVRVDPATRSIVLSLTFADISGSPSELELSPDGSMLYWINGGIYRMSLQDTGLPATAFIARGNHTWYALGVNPENGDLYAGDALDYVQAGRIYRYPAGSSTASDTFSVGVIPGAFLFP